MIILHNVKGVPFAINAGLIERVEGSTETHVMLVTGTSYLVRESVEEVVSLHREDRALVQAQAGEQLNQRNEVVEPSKSAPTTFPLHLVAPAVFGTDCEES